MHKLGDVLNELMARRGLARVQATEGLEQAWQVSVGEPLAGLTRVGSVSRGVLEIRVGNSALVQELTFRKAALLATLAEQLPELTIKNLKFRVARLE